MKNDLVTFLCRGFNRYFDVPRLCHGRKAVFRTAVVTKKKDFHDEWHDYDALIVDAAERVSAALGAQMEVRVSELSAGPFPSFANWREWCDRQMDVDPECIGPEPITEVWFKTGGDVVGLMSWEDWSDVGKFEPYAVSYTYSFYSLDADVDEKIFLCLSGLLDQHESVSSVSHVVESHSPRWYWKPLDFLRSLIF